MKERIPPIILSIVIILFSGLIVFFLRSEGPPMRDTGSVFVIRHRSWLGKGHGYLSVVQHTPTGRCYILPRNGPMLETSEDMCKVK